MMKFLGKLLSQCITLLVMLVIIGGAAALGIVLYYSKDLPDYQTLASYNPPVVTRLYAADGRLIEEYAKEHRLFVPISAIPKRVINAFLAAEDKNFYSHPGVDISSLFRAMGQNLVNLSENKSMVGGSTITQQVVKNFLLTNERSLSRKIKEAILSFRISQLYSKDRILELYLNQIYLGSGSYGVASAALNYFNRSLDDLAIEEVAFLAAMPKAPSTYDPRRNYDKAKARRDWVIERMAEEEFITPVEEKESMAKPITLHSREGAEVARADFFAEAVRKDIAARYGSGMLYEGGLAVRTTLDPALQAAAEKAFRRGIISYDQRHGFRGPIARLSSFVQWPEQLKAQKRPASLAPWKLAVVLELDRDRAIIGLEDGKKGAIPMSEMQWAKAGAKTPAAFLHPKDVIAVESVESGKKGGVYALRQIPEVSGGMVVLDPHTGKVLAMVGGFAYGENQFNRVMQAKRQPGSAFKPFVYLSALESGFTPASIIVDGPIELSQGAGLPMWRPKNYSGDFLGPTTLRVGVEKSRNLMTVRLAQMLGINKIMEVTKRFGINDNPQRNFSTVLGASETTLLQLTNAYAILVGGGKQLTPSLIERIQDRNGTTIYKRDERTCKDCMLVAMPNPMNAPLPVLEDNREEVTDPRSAYQMISIMEGVVQRGTAASAKKLGRTLGGKTGTTNDSYDTWFVGFTPDLVIGTYIGYDNPRTLGKKETGASLALPVFIHFVEEALKDKPDVPFRTPPGIQLVKIDARTGRYPTGSTPEKNIIYEAFKSGTGPQSVSVSEEAESDEGAAHSGEALPSELPAAPTVGTGGIY